METHHRRTAEKKINLGHYFLSKKVEQDTFSRNNVFGIKIVYFGLLIIGEKSLDINKRTSARQNTSISQLFYCGAEKLCPSF